MNELWRYVEPFGPIFWCGFFLGVGVGCIFTTILWVTLT